MVVHALLLLDGAVWVVVDDRIAENLIKGFGWEI